MYRIEAKTPKGGSLFIFTDKSYDEVKGICLGFKNETDIKLVISNQETKERVETDLFIKDKALIQNPLVRILVERIESLEIDLDHYKNLAEHNQEKYKDCQEVLDNINDPNQEDFEDFSPF